MGTLFNEEYTVSASITFNKNENGASIQDIKINNRANMWEFIYALTLQAKTNMSNKEIIITIIDIAKQFGEGTLETLLQEIISESQNA